jgi:predicted DNA-binding transcriptional regulator AlpA
MHTKVILEARAFRVSVLPEGRVQLELDDVTHLPENDTEAIYDVAGVASRLGTSMRSIANYMRQKRNPLPYSKVGGMLRFREQDLQQWLTDGGSPAARRARQRARLKQPAHTQGGAQ